MSDEWWDDAEQNDGDRFDDEIEDDEFEF